MIRLYSPRGELVKAASAGPADRQTAKAACDLATVVCTAIGAVL
jgi:hypothetical protein